MHAEKVGIFLRIAESLYLSFLFQNQIQFINSRTPFVLSLRQVGHPNNINDGLMSCKILVF